MKASTISAARAVSLFLSLAGLSLSTVAGAIPYSPQKTIAAMTRSDPKLKIIVAHRGAYGPLCPENSICAIDRAVEDGAEAIEIDVKETKDGVTWPSHDITIGRGTNYSTNGWFFDPFRYDADNEKNNPLLENMTAAAIKKTFLRDINGHETALRSVSLSDLIATSAFRHANVVYVFDIKYPQSVAKVADMVKRLNIADASVLKFSATFFNFMQIYKHTKGVPFSLTLYAPQMDQIAETNNLHTAGYDNRVYQYLKGYTYVDGFKYFEIGNKMFVKSGQSVAVEGPMASLTRLLMGDKYAVSNFIPVVEHRADQRSPLEGFYHTNGHCCTRLIDFLATTKHFGNERRDDRPDMQSQVRFNDSVITDDAVRARGFAGLNGNRQNRWMILR